MQEREMHAWRDYLGIDMRRPWIGNLSKPREVTPSPAAHGGQVPDFCTITLPANIFSKWANERRIYSFPKLDLSISQLIASIAPCNPYAATAEKFRPKKTTVLFVAEASPIAVGRYFYFESVQHYVNPR
jgi:hypothetical protein